MTLGLNRGEMLLVAIIFGSIWIAGILPKIAKRLAGSTSKAGNGGEGAENESDGDGTNESSASPSPRPHPGTEPEQK